MSCFVVVYHIIFLLDWFLSSHSCADWIDEFVEMRRGGMKQVVSMLIMP